MPTAARRPCTYFGCGRLQVEESRCALHQRAGIRQRGYADPLWSRLRAAHLASSPACVQCGSTHRLNVDHIVAHKGNEALRLDPSNLQTLCASCHSRKTVQQDGGFGRG